MDEKFENIAQCTQNGEVDWNAGYWHGGITASATHPRTVKAATKLVALFHPDNVASFFREGVEKKHFLVLCILDCQSIHTKRRSSFIQSITSS